VGLIGSAVVGRGLEDARVVDLRSTSDFEVWWDVDRNQVEDIGARWFSYRNEKIQNLRPAIEDSRK
jgi:hypothetical protein